MERTISNVRDYGFIVVYSLFQLTFLASLCLGGEPVKVTVSASFRGRHDPLEALCDGQEPERSFDRSIPRFTFWNHRGGEEWVQYDFPHPRKISRVDVYWYDDRPEGRCRIPKSWSLYYQNGYRWKPVDPKNTFGNERDCYNVVEFDQVRASAIRIRVEQQPGMSSGILEWKIEGHSPHLVGKTTPARDVSADDGNISKKWLVYSTLISKGDTQAAGALQHLQNILERFSADAGSDSHALQQALREGNAWDDSISLEKTLTQLHRNDPETCLRLMIQLDWLRQDMGSEGNASFKELSLRPISELEKASSGRGPGLVARYRRMLDEKPFAWDAQWKDLYLEACRCRRRLRMQRILQKIPRIVFTKHHDIGGQHYAYTEDISDSPYNDNNPFPSGGKLCVLEKQGSFGHVRTLLEEPQGLIRDPAVSFDGQRILFARRHSMTDDDYHLYEMKVDQKGIRQLTFGEGVADYEPAYLPGGGIVFNSTRCQQIVDCWWADVSNLYTCDSEGRYLRRLSFDQVHTNYPQVLPDGRVIYTRWDYNDRGQLFPQPLFQMNADGTGQREYYGNNSWFPTTILHARGIPNSQKVVCILSGHHTYQKGKLAVIDPRLGRQENAGVQLIAPIRPTEAVRVDKYGYLGEQFQYPYALSEREFLVAYSPEGSKAGRAPAETPFGIYFMTLDGRRELLAADPTISCNQPVPLVPRVEPQRRPIKTDYRKDSGIYYLQDIYQGPGLRGVPRGTIKQLRVVALEFRAAGIGSGGNRGPAGGALVSTPISINGAWDVKRVLGTARVYEDGSACFRVPARTPVYFQALDHNHHAVQTMRSWSTLQPGENFSCVGCHEAKNTTPRSDLPGTAAMKAGPQALNAVQPKSEGFSFPRRIQPILDRHCVECHNRQTVREGESSFSLEGKGTLDTTGLKQWSDAYRTLADRKYCDWISPQSPPTMLPPYHAGASQSRLMELLEKGHENVRLADAEMKTLACWIDLGVPFAGTYTETMPPEHAATYDYWLTRRRKWERQEAENIASYLKSQEDVFLSTRDR